MSRVVIIAGEASGDRLGAGLIRAARARNPDLEFEGVAGEEMRAAGCRPWFDCRDLAVMGLFEVLRHLPLDLGELDHLGWQGSFYLSEGESGAH